MHAIHKIACVSLMLVPLYTSDALAFAAPSGTRGAVQDRSAPRGYSDIDRFGRWGGRCGDCHEVEISRTSGWSVGGSIGLTGPSANMSYSESRTTGWRDSRGNVCSCGREKGGGDGKDGRGGRDGQ